MNCENYLCIYQDKGHCTLDKIELDVLGQCKECIYVDINDADLERYKQLKKNKIK